MKLPTLALFFFLFGLAAADLVRDVDGDLVLNNFANYYILPANGKGGGLELFKDCSIVQAPKNESDGLPVKFLSPFGVLSIYSGLYLNIEFTKPPEHCPRPTRWTIPGEYSSEKENTPVKAGDDIRVLGPFQVREYEDHYKLVYCKEISLTESECTNLGIDVDDDNVRHLVLLKDGSEPFKVQFKIARDSKSSKKRSIV